MGKKILIVEDEGITSFELETKIENWGYSVIGIAISGAEAFDMAMELKPDLIIMDIRLNGIEDGVEVIEKIRSRIEVPFIYVTALSSDKIMSRAHKTDPYAFIIKPFDDMELKFAIELAFYKHDLEEKFKKSDKKYTDLMNNLMTGIFIADMDGNIMFINSFLADILSNTSSKNAMETNEIFQNHFKTKIFLEKLKKDGEIHNQMLKIVLQNKRYIAVNLSAKLKDNLIYGVATPQLAF